MDGRTDATRDATCHILVVRNEGKGILFEVNVPRIALNAVYHTIKHLYIETNRKTFKHAYLYTTIFLLFRVHDAADSVQVPFSWQALCLAPDRFS